MNACWRAKAANSPIKEKPMPDKPSTPPQSNSLDQRSARKLKLTVSLAALLFAGVAITGLAGRFAHAGETRAWTEKQAVPVVQLIALHAANGGNVSLPGQAQAFYTATINAQVTGYVQRWYSDIGAEVKEGQLLAQIDPRPYQAALDQARGQLARDNANLTEAQLDLQRYQYLVKQNAISAQQFTTQQATVAADQGIVQTDKAAVETAQINLNYTRIVAPFDGVVTSRSADVGQLVTANSTSATPLFTVTDQSKLRIYVQVPQSYSYLIKPGMTARFTVPEFPGRAFSAELVASAGAIVSQSGTQLVQFQIDNSDHLLKPGEYATVNFGIAAGARGVRVPVTALMFRDQGMFVASIGKDGRVVMQNVHIETDFGTAVDVNIGLKDGDKVIDNPPDSLRAGDLVRTVGKSSAV
jgi:RND family efflux transporter MFP subunit